MMLAIAAPRFDSPSETFIRDHVRMIAPGDVILLCKDSSGTKHFGSPVLEINARRPIGSLPEQPMRAIRYLWQRYVDPGLWPSDRQRVLDFFAMHTPRAVLAEYGFTGCLVMRACEEAAVPLYAHFHGIDASRLVGEWHWVRHYGTLFRNAAGIIVPSHFLAGKLMAIGCPATKLHVSPNGVDPQRFAPSRPIGQRVLAVGRLVEKKAPQLTIEAFGRIAGRVPAARLDIVGDGPLTDRCHALITRLGLKNRIHMHGAQSSDFVARLMREASVFVQHSVTAANGDAEGFGISLVEAMACKVPVVATRHNGFVETVQDGISGLLVDEHDVVAMANAIAELLENPDRAAIMGAAGRQRVLSHFTHEKARDRLRVIMRFPPLTSSEAQTG